MRGPHKIRRKMVPCAAGARAGECSAAARGLRLTLEQADFDPILSALTPLRPTNAMRLWSKRWSQGAATYLVAAPGPHRGA
jgi:hypothetical protein